MMELILTKAPGSMGNDVAHFTLMLEESPVMELSLAPSIGLAVGVGRIFDSDKAPLAFRNCLSSGTTSSEGAALFNQWWRRRHIPPERRGLRRALRNFDGACVVELAMRSLGLSLSDQYWLKPSGSGLSWGGVNLFENDFDDLVGISLASESSFSGPSLPSPSICTNGYLPKFWRIELDGSRTLLKTGSGALRQEPFNEAAAAAVHRLLLAAGEYVPYRTEFMGGFWVSACPCMADASSSLTDARSILEYAGFDGRECGRAELDSAFAAAGVQDAGLFLDKMAVCDFLIGNTDRHLGNFGAFMDADTGLPTRMAPIYDSGESLLNRIVDEPFDVSALTAGPSRASRARLLAEVRDFSWLDAEALGGLADMICSIVGECPNRYMDGERLTFLHAFVQANAEAVTAAANCDFRNLEAREEAIDRTFADAMKSMAEGRSFQLPQLEAAPGSFRGRPDDFGERSQVDEILEPA